MSIPHYRVVTVPSPPYVIEKQGGGYEGFVVDVLTQVADKAGFNFTMYPSKDGMYGGPQGYGRWSGMVGEVARKEALIAASDLSITKSRAEVVDFTSPILEQTSRMLMRRPVPIDDNFPIRLGFLLEPFSSEIWLCILIAALVASLLFMLTGRFDPYEWRQVPSDKDPRGARHSFGLRDSLMFVFSTLFLQGYRETPRSLSGRTLAVSWFFFTFFVVVAYLAGVVSFTLAGRHVAPSVPFETVSDLASQSRVKLAVIRDGRTFNLLKNSKVESFHRLATTIEVMNTSVDTLSEGIQRVKDDGDYVMLAESMRAEYIVRQDCSLMLHGPGIFPSGIGFAVARRSSLLDAMNSALLEMMEDGTIEMLKQRWWGPSRCPPGPPTSRGGSGGQYWATQRTIEEIALPFIFLAAGAILAIILLVVEVVFRKVRP